MSEDRSEQSPTRYVLRLYVTGRSSNSAAALRNLTRFCERWLHGRYELRVIDVLKEPAAALQDEIVATPTLVRAGPAAPVKIFGSMTDESQLAIALAIAPPEPANPRSAANAAASSPPKRAPNGRHDEL